MAESDTTADVATGGGALSLPARLSEGDIEKLIMPRGSLAEGSGDYERHLMFTIPNASLSETKCGYFRCDITCFRCGQRGHKKGECRTWRTKMCNNGENCTNGENCPFAHNNSELRTPWVARCIRIIRVDGRLRHIGCGETGHTFRECPCIYSRLRRQSGFTDRRSHQRRGMSDDDRAPYQICGEVREDDFCEEEGDSVERWVRSGCVKDNSSPIDKGMQRSASEWDKVLLDLGASDDEEEAAKLATTKPGIECKGVLESFTQGSGDREEIERAMQKTVAVKESLETK